MGLIAVVGLILVVVGILGLLHVLAFGLSAAIIVIVVGLLCVVFGGRNYYNRV